MYKIVSLVRDVGISFVFGSESENYMLNTSSSLVHIKKQKKQEYIITWKVKDGPDKRNILLNPRGSVYQNINDNESMKITLSRSIHHEIESDKHLMINLCT